jgi:hypothetical protein
MDVELVLCFVRMEDPDGDGELIGDFWPVNGSVGATEAQRRPRAARHPDRRRT